MDVELLRAGLSAEGADEVCDESVDETREHRADVVGAEVERLGDLVERGGAHRGGLRGLEILGVGHQGASPSALSQVHRRGVRAS